MSLTTEMNDFYYHMALYELQMMNESDYYDGLSYNSLLYINVISQMKECTASKIAEALQITRPAVTLKLNELEKQGAIVKTRNESDKRILHIRLSPRMEKTIAIYDEVFNKIEADLSKMYAKEELETFEKILRTISDYEWRNIKNE